MMRMMVGLGLWTMACRSEPPAVVPQVVLDVQPVRTVYRTGQQLSLSAVTEPKVAVAFDGSPANAVSISAGGVARLVAPGPALISACTVVEPIICDSVELLVDDGAPRIEVVQPLPADELDGSMIEVVGSVVDARDTTVFVNGQLAALDDVGQFSLRVTPQFGIVPIEVVANDGFAEAASVTFDVLAADRFLPAVNDGHPEVSFEDGLVLQLGLPFFDDGAPLDRTASPLVTRDLADLLELVVANTDLTGTLPDPILDNGPEFFLRIPDVEVGSVESSVEITADGLDLYVRFLDVEVDTEGQLDLSGVPLNLTGQLNASLTAFARLNVSDPSKGPIDATLDQLDVSLDTIVSDFEDEQVDALFGLAASALRTVLEDELRGTIDTALASTLPTLVTETLNALDTALREQSIPLEIPGAVPLTLELDARIATLDLEPQRALRAVLQSRFGVATPPRFASRGYAAWPIMEEDPLFASRPAQLALPLDLLNGAAHALWNAGLLDLDLGPLIPPELASLFDAIDLDARLPPILRPPRGPSPFDLVIEVGQLELDLSSLGARGRFGVSIAAGVSLQLVEGQLTLAVADAPEVRAWPIGTPDEKLVIDDVVLEALLTDFLWPTLRDAITSALAIDLPPLDGAVFGDIAPGLESFAYRYSLGEPVEVRSGSVILDVELLGELP
ncbi:MAG: hypothetical protein AAGA48_36865 [Myxococcota bacterium]